MNYSLSRFSVGPGQVKAARKALEKLVTAIHKNDPEVVYLVFQESDHPVFFTLVSFQDETIYRRHATSPHVAEFARTILPLCDGKPSFVGLDLVIASRVAEQLQAARRPAAPRARAQTKPLRLTNPRVPRRRSRSVR
jgi:quinol monooxygenase YgiN